MLIRLSLKPSLDNVNVFLWVRSVLRYVLYFFISFVSKICTLIARDYGLVSYREHLARVRCLH